MVGFEISYRANGKSHLLKGDRNGRAELVMLGAEAEKMLLVFDFFDPDINYKPLPEIRLDYSYGVFTANDGQKPKKIFSVFGKKAVDERGRLMLEIPLGSSLGQEVCMDIKILHMGVGAYQDDEISLDIPIRKGYN